MYFFRLKFSFLNCDNACENKNWKTCDDYFIELIWNQCENRELVFNPKLPYAYSKKNMWAVEMSPGVFELKADSISTAQPLL